MPEHDATGDFDQSWCLALENDPRCERITTHSLIPRASTESSLVAELLHNRRGIRGMRTYLKRNLSNGKDNMANGETGDAVDEAILLFSLGDGVNGNANICHGGFIGLMLDEVTGELASKVFNQRGIVTAGLTLAYKRKLLTPAVVLCRARAIGNISGRKIEVEGSIEDGHGGVYATGSTVFVRLDRKL